MRSNFKQNEENHFNFNFNTPHMKKHTRMK